MGVNDKILSEKTINKSSKHFTNALLVERCEDMQIHHRNNRLQFSGDEFKTFCKTVISGYKAWEDMGFPPPNPKTSTIQGLAGNYHKLPAVHGIGSDKASIELLTGDDYIHFHYRSLRVDLSYEEFLELADLFCEAKKNFEKHVGGSS